jgi:hypothetical protein
MPATQWNQLVKDTFTAGRQKNKSYQLKDAMSDAKLVYNKQGGSGSCGLMKGGNDEDQCDAAYIECKNANLNTFVNQDDNEDTVVNQAEIDNRAETESNKKSLKPLGGKKKKRTKKHHKKSKGGKKSKSNHKKSKKGSRRH